MNALRLQWIFVRIAVLNELQYRANFYIALFRSLLGLGTGLAALAVVFSHTTTLGGWRPEELLALLGIYLMVGGIINVVIRPSMQRLMEDVRQGTLDFALTKPEDAQLLVSVRQVEVWKLIDFTLGAGVLLIALFRLGDSIGVGQAVAFGLALLAGTVIVYSFWLILATCSFWVVRVENILVIFQSMYEAGRWPVTIYPRWLQVALTFIVPVAFATSVPAQALAGRLSWSNLAFALVLAAALLVGSRLFWTYGIRHYSGASA